MRPKSSRLIVAAKHYVASKAKASGRVTRRVDDTKGKPAPVAPFASSWMVVMVAPNGETQAVKALTDAGWTAWRPQVKEVRRFPAKKLERVVFRPLFPRYIFVSGEGHKSILACDKVSRILSQRADHELVSELSDRQAQGEFDKSKPLPPVQKGDAVEASEGPFAGLQGIVARADHERVVILMDILGKQQKVTMPASNVRKVA